MGANAVAAVVFDMDGTLLDTETLYRDAFMAAARRVGVAVPPPVYARLVGISTRERGQILRRYLGPAFPWDALRDAYYAERAIRLRTGLRVQAGVDTVLDRIERTGLPSAVATSASRETAEARLRGAGLRDRFEVVVTRDDVARGKPHPDPFATAARRLRVPAWDCLAVEDSLPGLSSARAAGMPAVLVAGDSAPSPATRARCVGVLRHIGELITLLPAAGNRNPAGPWPFADRTAEGTAEPR